MDRTRYHACELIEHAAKESGLHQKGLFNNNASTFKVMSRKAFISSVLGEYESVEELGEELKKNIKLVKKYVMIQYIVIVNQIH